ncbi:MAG: efflux RND transporter permease subunit [Dehalococcoidia bacterium]
MFTRLALRYRIITIVLMLAVMAGGAYSLTKLQVALLPDIEFPAVTIAAPYPGALPQQVLDDVTLPIEGALADLDGVTTLQTLSAPGLAQVVVLADFGEDMQAFEAEINRRLQGLDFPAEVAPQVGRISLDQFPIVTVAITGNNDISALAATVRSQVVPALEEVPGVISADIPQGLEEGTAISRANGEPSVTISILKHPDANTIEVANAAMERLEDLTSALPAGTEFIEISNQAPEIQASIDEVTQHVALGAIFAVIMMFAFLLSVRPTLVTSVAIPVSLLAAFIVMHLQGLSLNILTLGGLAIAVGRVVDDSIVVMENTFRHMQNGESPGQAALNGAREVAVPITASTLTTIAVFLPLAFIGGFISVIFLPFALTIVYALLASLVVALTIVPVLSAMLIPRVREHRENLLERTYVRTVRAALSHRLLTLGAAAALTVLSLFLLPFIPVGFLPTGGESVLSLQVTVPGNADRDTVLSELDDVEAVLEDMRQDGEVEAYSSTYGSTDLFSGMGSSNGANLQVRLAHGVDGQATAEMLRQTLPTETRDVRISTIAGGAPDSSSLELTLQGENYALLAQTAEDLTERVSNLDGLVNVSHNAVNVEGAPAEVIAMLPIVRMDGRQSVTISGTITAQNTQAVNLEIQSIVSDNPLPEGVDLVTGGVFADIDEAFQQMAIAMGISVILVYLVMVVTQRSFVIPFIILLALPLAFIGAFGLLFVTQRALGLPSLMGLLMLVGLVVTNAIVLIAFIEQLRARGMGMWDALVEGGRTRLRPILMTALTTTFVLMPMALGIGAEGAGIIGAELATVVIGGLLASTFLTLVVIPVVYSFLRKKGPKQVEAPAAATEPAGTGIGAPIREV